MYPSKTDPLFGVFVKNFKEILEKEKVVFTATSVIKGKKAHNLLKIFSYIKYYCSVVFNFLFRKYDLVYVHYLSHNAPVLSFLLFLFKKRKPLIVNVHGNDIIDSQGKKIDKLNKYVLKRTDLIVTPSSYFKELMLKTYTFLKPNQLFISPSAGVDNTRFYPIARPDNPVPIIGMISRIDKGKGWDIFLKALYVLKAKNVLIKTIIAGQGLEEEDMKQMIKEYDLSSDVEFLGLIEQNQLVHLYNKMDILVFPTTREAESLGLVGLEAMSCKTPVIGSNIAGPKTYIQSEKNGMLFHPGNAEELASCIEIFLNFTKEQKNHMRDAAYHTSKQYNSTSVMLNLHTKLMTLCTGN